MIIHSVSSPLIFSSMGLEKPEILARAKKLSPFSDILSPGFTVARKIFKPGLTEARKIFKPELNFLRYGLRFLAEAQITI